MVGWQGKHGPYLIAEIGGNHEGNFEYAQKLTDLACDSGVDAVKFQIYKCDTLVNKSESPERYSHFERFQLTQNQHIKLAKKCRDKGVTYVASVWNVEAIEWIDPYMNFYKIGSGDLTAYPILKKIASIAKPIILSTGLSTLEEVKEAVNYIQSQNKRYKDPDYLALLQCTSMYPIPDEDANLKVMNLFREEFQLAVGYSDHTIGADAVEIAVAMGAEIIEMHFTDKRESQSFRDHHVSFTCEEIKSLIDKIRKIKSLQGSIKKEPAKSEIDAGHVATFRRAVYPDGDLKSGTVLQENDLTILRPNHGIDARDYKKLIGKKLRKDVEYLRPLSWDDMQ
jgi:N-acetylneuraminate synthase/N,N'-diacetyllegionaminate synthase